MTAINIHRTIAVLINLFFIGLVLWVTYMTDSDKSIVLVLFYFPILIVVNLGLWFLLRKLKPTHSIIYKQTFIGLIVLFIPSIFLATLF